jgi:hypothetical protein
LFSGEKSPVPFALNDITALLVKKRSLRLASFPSARAALPGSLAEIENPELVNCLSRSLFATLIQAHNLWGRVARRACLDEQNRKHSAVNLWEGTSEYSQLSTALNQWEADLSRGHRWSDWYLRVYKTENLDLVCLHWRPIFKALLMFNRHMFRYLWPYVSVT